MASTLKTAEVAVGTADPPSVPTERVTIPVTGMTCAACQSFIQRTLTEQTGVQDATVNLMLNNATITFIPKATSTSALVESIRHT
ncbi:MAG TPA: heavy metal-associated domain-containing protein, partial [Edaphobacter sp.]|nr:heavy metal-associated domain-containing protein [Edaphobacter sp.]